MEVEFPPPPPHLTPYHIREHVLMLLTRILTWFQNQIINI